MGLEDAISAAKRLKALAKAEVLEAEAFGLSEQQINFAKERHRFYSTVLEMLETEPLEDVVAYAEKVLREIWDKEPKTIADKARMVATESFLRAIGLESKIEDII
ncbi:hypothetical protein HPY42_03560 [Coprothermobacteraceae bacterium]|nr:hypothetical protein [Coprothermobacteraceae bacterium]